MVMLAGRRYCTGTPLDTNALVDMSFNRAIFTMSFWYLLMTAFLSGQAVLDLMPRNMRTKSKVRRSLLPAARSSIGAFILVSIS